MKIYTGYLIIFRSKGRDPMRISIEAGIEAIRQREEGRTTLLYRGGSYEFMGMDIVPLKREVISQGGITEDELIHRLQEALNQSESLQLKNNKATYAQLTAQN